MLIGSTASGSAPGWQNEPAFPFNVAHDVLSAHDYYGGILDDGLHTLTGRYLKIFSLSFPFCCNLVDIALQASRGDCEGAIVSSVWMIIGCNNASVEQPFLTTMACNELFHTSKITCVVMVS